MSTICLFDYVAIVSIVSPLGITIAHSHAFKTYSDHLLPLLKLLSKLFVDILAICAFK